MKSAKWRTRSIGRGVKRPKSSNMRGLSSNQKAKLRNIIIEQKDIQRKNIRESRIDLKKIERASISLVGLDQLSKNSIKRLQDTRQIAMMRLIRNTSDLMVASRKISNLENQLLSIKK